MSTGLLLDPRFLRHETGPGHPEAPARLAFLYDRFEQNLLLERTIAVPARAASIEEIALVHEPAYIRKVQLEIEAGQPQLSTGDTNISEASWDVALHATGGLLEAVDQVCTGTLQNAFCASRPPGHHATRNRGMGFCIFNAVSVAARYAQRTHGLERVAIVDWDVHHGNGTQSIFYEDPSVFYFSTHQSPWYPGTGSRHETGAGDAEGTVLNAPFPAGTGMLEIESAFRDGFLPAMEAFRPDLILISAGFDSRENDPLGRFLLQDRDFRELTLLLRDLASRHCEHRVVSVLEGGYHLEGLATAAAAHLEALLE